VSWLKLRPSPSMAISVVALVAACAGTATATTGVVSHTATNKHKSTKQTGPRGPRGARGATGLAGAPGAAGPAGSAGLVGPTGPAGQKGETGAKGETGGRGETGTAGVSPLTYKAEFTWNGVTSKLEYGNVSPGVTITRPETGEYLVKFPASIAACVPVASFNGDPGGGIATGGGANFLSAQRIGTDEVEVLTEKGAAPQDGGVGLIVSC
jgi:hypothetical protein